tara:strand:+ start:12073 stop:12564 length:492 start_codon:yes stop_codon:yes gene_type:complete
MEQKYYSDKVLDDKFIELVDKKIEEICASYGTKTLSKIGINEVLLRSRVVCKHKPKSKHRHLKRGILDYLDYHIEEDSNGHSLKYYLGLKQEFLVHSNYLMEQEGFRHRRVWIWHFLVGLTLDSVLIYNDIAESYFNVPVFFILSFVIGLFKEHSAKKKGKLL